MPEPGHSSYSPILYFDGRCGFCSRWVRFILKWEKAPVIRFSASQDQNAQTVLFRENGRLYERSTAVLKIARYLKWIWPLGYVGFLVPRFLRDAIYDLVAKNRYRLFGDACALERTPDRFL